MATPASGLSLQAVRDYAERVGEKHNIYDESGHANVERLVHKLGGHVRVEAMPESLRVRDRGDFTIFVPLTTSERRDRFTIAHELGHYFLHYLFPGNTGAKSFGRGLSNRAETEANTFASSLLMPAGAFKEAFAKYDQNVHMLASIFDVSVRAAEVRCSVLKLT